MQSEVLTLQRRHLDLDAGTLRLDPGSTKNRKGRVVYLTAELNDLLAAQVARVAAVERATARVIRFLFPYLSGAVRCGHRRRDFRKTWLKATKAAGVPGRLRHDLRRTAVRNLERAGVSRSVSMAITGHKSEAVFRRYAIVAAGDLRDAAAKLSSSTKPSTTSPVRLASRRVTS